MAVKELEISVVDAVKANHCVRPRTREGELWPGKEAKKNYQKIVLHYRLIRGREK